MNIMTKQKRNLMASALPVLALCLSTAACSPGSNHETNPYVGSVRVDSTDTPEQIIEKAAHLVPTPRQLAAMENEFIAFIHFGPNTFTQREWGTGLEDPRVFDLKELHTDDWCRDMKEAGMKMVILTVKHHDGFCLWQTRYTRHGIMSTGYQEGKGDVLKELAASCQKYGLKLGIYLSPADLFQIESPEGLYGNGSQTSLRTIPREVADRPFENKTTFQFEVDDYNEYFLNQLFELLTEYGPVHEVWFDGAHPKRKGGQTYNYTAWRTLIRTLAPQATIFGREDVRWCGNEGGATRLAEFNVITYPEDPATMTEFHDIYGEPGTRQAYAEQQKPFYLHYEPAETNTSIRAGWFFSDDTHQEVRTADDVFDIYERSVGGNSIFLLNIPPTREGKFSERDAQVLREAGRRIRETYGEGRNLLQGAKGSKELLDGHTDTYKEVQEVILRTHQPITLNRIALREPVGQVGERIERHAVDAYIDGAWREIVQGTNIGYRRILRFADVTTDALRIRITGTRATPYLCSVAAYHYQQRPPMLTATQNLEGEVTIEPYFQAMHWWSFHSNSARELNAGCQIYYTTDTLPQAEMQLYTAPLQLENCDLKAVAVVNGERGPELTTHIGWAKKQWQVIGYSSQQEGQEANRIIDADKNTNWVSENGKRQFVSLDLGEEKVLHGFAYTPHAFTKECMIEKGIIRISADGRQWRDYETFEFGNLINDPTRRVYYFKQPVTVRFVQLQSIEIAGNGQSAGMAELDLF